MRAWLACITLVYFHFIIIINVIVITISIITISCVKGTSVFA